MAQQNARGRGSERTRRENVFHFLGLQNLRASEPSVAGPSGDDQRDNHFADAWTQKRRERDGEQGFREMTETR